MKSRPIEELSTAELNHYARVYSTDQTTEGSIMRRGIQAEIESRSTLSTEWIDGVQGGPQALRQYH
jgi:hypothetical protein